MAVLAAVTPAQPEAIAAAAAVEQQPVQGHRCCHQDLGLVCQAEAASTCILACWTDMRGEGDGTGSRSTSLLEKEK